MFLSRPLRLAGGFDRSSATHHVRFAHFGYGPISLGIVSRKSKAACPDGSAHSTSTIRKEGQADPPPSLAIYHHQIEVILVGEFCPIKARENPILFRSFSINFDQLQPNPECGQCGRRAPMFGAFLNKIADQGIRRVAYVEKHLHIVVASLDDTRCERKDMFGARNDAPRCRLERSSTTINDHHDSFRLNASLLQVGARKRVVRISLIVEEAHFHQSEWLTRTRWTVKSTKDRMSTP
eukprot:scaffold1697_cov180-Amphora_coffeaeformis.AAC.3